MVIGLAGNAAFVTVANPAAVPITSHVMLYVVGELVVPLYASAVVCALVLIQTLVAAIDVVIVGEALTVTVTFWALLQPLAVNVII